MGCDNSMILNRVSSRASYDDQGQMACLMAWFQWSGIFPQSGTHVVLMSNVSTIFFAVLYSS